MDEQHKVLTEETKTDSVSNVPELSTETSLPQIITVGNSNHHRGRIYLVAAALLLGAAVVFTGMKLLSKPAKQVDRAETQTSEVAVEEKEVIKKPKDINAELQRFMTPSTGETWYATSKSMQPQGWLKAELRETYSEIQPAPGYTPPTIDEQMRSNAPTYKEVGMRGDKTIIFVYGPLDTRQRLQIFEKDLSGTVRAILKPQSTASIDSDQLSALKEALVASKVGFDETTYYDSLSVPGQIALDNGESVVRPEYLGLASGIYNPQETTEGKTLVSTYGSNKLYRIESRFEDTKLTNIGYTILTPLGTWIVMSYEPNRTSLAGYKFDDGTSMLLKSYQGKMEADKLMAIARGCGGDKAPVTRSETLRDSDLIRVGVTDTGRTVYAIKDSNHALVRKAYDEYKNMNSDRAVSFDEFLKAHALLIIKNASNEPLVYVRYRYAAVEACAKPVIYLYPTQTTTVSVVVGADVKQSEPLYPVEGWHGVVAHPNGDLQYGGLSYSSLFWEGQGLGAYPGISSGTIVKKADALPTIRRQLAAQGLQGREIDDFMAFWTDKIPSKPYIRLTWLTPKQIEFLAPLRINPQPETVIRVFLDMDGYDKPLKLAPQKLTSTSREGFTVVEWGGLTAEVRH